MQQITLLRKAGSATINQKISRNKIKKMNAHILPDSIPAQIDKFIRN